MACELRFTIHFHYTVGQPDCHEIRGLTKYEKGEGGGGKQKSGSS